MSDEMYLFVSFEELFMQNETFLESIREQDQSILCLAEKKRAGYYAAKRAMDFCIALALLVLLSPLMMLIAVLIYIYSPGPVFFVQERVGARRQIKDRKTYWKKVILKNLKKKQVWVSS